MSKLFLKQMVLVKDETCCSVAEDAAAIGERNIVSSCESFRGIYLDGKAISISRVAL